jgi:hypothetical protein
MKKFKLSLTILTVLLVFAGATSAQMITQAERPVWQPGLYWHYQNDTDSETLEYWVLGVRSIREVDHYVLAQRSIDGDEVSLSLAFAPVRSPFPRVTNTPDSQTYLDFPLEMDIFWTVRESASAGFLNSAGITAQLDAIEKVNTGFGLYDAFRITYTRNDDTWQLWYSSAISSWIKQTSPANGSAMVLQESWQFSLDYALDVFYTAIEPLLKTDRLGMRRLLNNLIRYEFDAPRAESLKQQL